MIHALTDPLSVACILAAVLVLLLLGKWLKPRFLSRLMRVYSGSDQVCLCSHRRALHSGGWMGGFGTDCRATGCDCQHFTVNTFAGSYTGRAVDSREFHKHLGETEAQMTQRLKAFQSQYQQAPDWAKMPVNLSPGSAFPTLPHAFSGLLILDYVESEVFKLALSDRIAVCLALDQVRNDPTLFPPSVVREFNEHMRAGTKTASAGGAA